MKRIKANRDDIERAGGRCECRGDCGREHGDERSSGIRCGTLHGQREFGRRDPLSLVYIASWPTMTVCPACAVGIERRRASQKGTLWEARA